MRGAGHQDEYRRAATTARDAARTPLGTFVREAREAYVAARGDVHVVVGNEACDLDSVACAVAYAYVESASSSSSSAMVVPIVSCAREDIYLRPDVVYALREVGVEIEDVLCLDDVVDADVATPKSICLVDHNALSARIFPRAWGGRVRRIIDHHEDARAHDQGECVKVIELIGSCASLVHRDVVAAKREALDASGARDVARLLLGAVVLDTRFLDASTTRASAIDFETADALRATLDWDEDAARREYETLSAARHDQSAFTCAQLLAKDYKQWTMGAYEIGVASFGVRLQDLAARQDASSIDAQCDAFMASRRVHALFMMTSFEDADAGGAYTRQIAVTRPVDGALDCADVMRRVNERTPVSPFDVDPNASTTTARALRASYAMADVKASRKKVQPILVDVFTALSAETQS